MAELATLNEDSKRLPFAHFSEPVDLSATALPHSRALRSVCILQFAVPFRQCCKMQIAKCKLQNANCKMQIAKCKLQNANCKMQIARFIWGMDFSVLLAPRLQ